LSVHVSPPVVDCAAHPPKNFSAAASAL